MNYLAGYHEVSINALFFRVFCDGDREYLTRAWLRDPSDAVSDVAENTATSSWNGEYYVSFAGEDREWAEAREHGFISGGGGAWYSNTLQLLSPGDRVWVNVPGTGYVGVGIVEAPRVPIDEFVVKGGDGKLVPITSTKLKIARRTTLAEDSDAAEYLVRVRWVTTVTAEEAVHERGLFGNQNTVARPKSEKWNHTIRRLKQRFGVQA